MLIEKNNNPEINDVVTIKLVSGEEVVGRLVARDIASVTLSKPIRIDIRPVNANQVGLSFAPFLGSVNDPSLQFLFSGLAIRPTKTGDDVTRNYIQATTGIVTPTAEQSAGILLP
jgi:hypothetical protein